MVFDQLFFGITFAMLGKILLGIAVMLVHAKIVKEQGIDGVVIKEIRRERNVALFGIILIIIGYALEISALYEIHFLGTF